jgi:hypothetical protein
MYVYAAAGVQQRQARLPLSNWKQSANAQYLLPLGVAAAKSSTPLTRDCCACAHPPHTERDAAEWHGTCLALWQH